ncbi:MAG: S41 family peptidase [Firmicutes bacterium]|nr:S41 family peptidase [Bacillota bacterium]
MKARTIIIGLAALLLVGFAVFLLVRHKTDPQPNTYVQARNLQKLSRVWGFAKYTHRSFLLGERCWDEELLYLIPVIRFANEDEVNDVLYRWFISLGDDGYDLDWEAYRLSLVAYYEGRNERMSRLMHEHLILITQFFGQDVNESDFHWEYIDHTEIVSFILEYDGVYDWEAFQTFMEDYYRIKGMEINLRTMADKSWINEVYLGEQLFSRLSRFNQVQLHDLTNAPVYFDWLGNSAFSNKYSHPDMDHSCEKYRLLGLFRLWNAMEYFFPYMDIIDYCWHELLLEFIPKMLEGTDRLSYELTLAALSSRLRDAHISLIHTFFLNEQFGQYSPSVRLVEAEGQLVVHEVRFTQPFTPLRRGDVILTLSGRDINDVAAHMLRYLSFPNDEKALAYLAFYHHILRSHSPRMEVGVLRGGEELRLTVPGHFQWFTHPTRIPPLESHWLLEHNIGLINPGMLPDGSIPYIMNEFADTQGLIVDLRQYPYPGFETFELAGFVIEERQPHFIISLPLWPVPGVFIDTHHHYSGGINSPDAFLYEKNVVVLMDESSVSASETLVMSLRNGANVTVMGTNSIGANGNITVLPLPGGSSMVFTGLGVYTPQGGQTQRIGLSPDIYVHRTIAGIAEGRDELMEAAIAFLLQP